MLFFTRVPGSGSNADVLIFEDLREDSTSAGVICAKSDIWCTEGRCTMSLGGGKLLWISLILSLKYELNLVASYQDDCNADFSTS